MAWEWCGCCTCFARRRADFDVVAESMAVQDGAPLVSGSVRARDGTVRATRAMHALYAVSLRCAPANALV